MRTDHWIYSSFYFCVFQWHWLDTTLTTQFNIELYKYLFVVNVLLLTKSHIIEHCHFPLHVLSSQWYWYSAQYQQCYFYMWMLMKPAKIWQKDFHTGWCKTVLHHQASSLCQVSSQGLIQTVYKNWGFGWIISPILKCERNLNM